MSFKNIENKEIVNLQNCDSEPIHIPGSIQPHGYLLAVDTSNTVIFCSDNAAMLGFTTADILNKNLAGIFKGEEGASLMQYILGNMFVGAKPHLMRHNGIEYNVLVHRQAKYLVVEFEALPDASPALPDVYLQTKNFTENISKASSMQSLCHLISDEIRAITGYDRVMVYKFDKQYNGEIFAESKQDALEPFLGLHYPHTDIPLQARTLYMANLMRMIGDINYTPVPIVTRDMDATHAAFDMSHCLLRSVSHIHVDYLKNMGVGATLTISLMWDDKLWGLIACHHYSAKTIPHHIRLAAMLQGHFLTSQIRVQEAAEDYRVKLGLDAALQSFLQVLNDKGNSLSHFVTEELIKVTHANGVCLAVGNELVTYGDTPAEQEINDLLVKFDEDGIDNISSSNIVADFGMTLSNNIAGLLYYRLDANSSVIWFRNELKQEIRWAGDPAKAIVKDSNGLNPRKSFAEWKEIVSNNSSEWLQAEIDVANQCVYAIQKYISISKSREIEISQRNLLVKLKAANDELENLNWISTHDLREPLRKINVFSSLLLDADRYKLEDDTTHLIKRLSLAANRMQMLIEDLLSYSKIKNQKSRFEQFDLNLLLQDVLEDNEEGIEAKHIKVKKDKLPEILCVPVLMRQLFYNLINNAVKFARTDVQSEISITYKQVKEHNKHYHEIAFADNGIGFDNQYGDVIFQIFQRLDKALNFRGTGIGLAICKKIADLHNGTITANGEVNKGATFTLLLPMQV